MKFRVQEHTIADVDHLRAYIDLGHGSAAGSLLLADVWGIDPYECGGNVIGTFTRGDTPENEAVIYFSSRTNESPVVQRATVSETAESFTLGSLKVWSRKSIAA